VVEVPDSGIPPAQTLLSRLAQCLCERKQAEHQEQAAAEAIQQCLAVHNSWRPLPWPWVPPRGLDGAGLHPPPGPMSKPFTLVAVAVLALPTAASATPWRDEPAVTALFRDAGVEGTFVLLDERRGELRGHNRGRAEQRFSPASTFKVANALIGLSLGAVQSVDERIPYTGDANPFMREWLEPMGLRGAMRVSNVPLYQELARRIGLARMRAALERLHYGNEQIGTNVTTFWLRGPLAISAVEQTRFLSGLAHQRLPFPRSAQRQVAEITQVDAGAGWSLHAKTGWQNAPGPGVGWWVGWVRRGDQITPFALNLAMAGAADAPKREQLGRASLRVLGTLPGD
jgi:beta-lactamase class D